MEHSTNFAAHKADGFAWITVFDSPFYPDYLESASALYDDVQGKFTELAATAANSADLLRIIVSEPNPLRVQLLRIFTKYVSPNTSVEMTKKKASVESVIKNFGKSFREIGIVRNSLASRPLPDEALNGILYQYANRGDKGYQLTEAFFLWFEATFEGAYTAEGPIRAGKDVILSSALPGYPSATPADILVRRRDGTPLVAGFARYDSDRGGAQEDDRTAGNRDKITQILAFAEQSGVPLKAFFLNDGPGLLLGSMWDDYASLEKYGRGRTLVCTLRMLSKYFTPAWLES